MEPKAEEMLLRRLISGIPNLRLAEPIKQRVNGLEMEYRLTRTDAKDGEDPQIRISGLLNCNEEQAARHFQAQLSAHGLSTAA